MDAYTTSEPEIWSTAITHGGVLIRGSSNAFALGILVFLLSACNVTIKLVVGLVPRSLDKRVYRLNDSGVGVSYE